MTVEECSSHHGAMAAGIVSDTEKKPNWHLQFLEAKCYFTVTVFRGGNESMCWTRSPTCHEISVQVNLGSLIGTFTEKPEHPC